MHDSLFPKAYLRFIELFNQAEYWESHEVLEWPWRENRSPFYRGVIIYASAFVHGQRGNPRGVRKQLLKAKRYLKEYRPVYMGLDIERLLSHLEECLRLVTVPDPPEDDELRRVLPFDRLELRREWVRGDEPELHET